MGKMLESPVLSISTVDPLSVEITNRVDVEDPGPALYFEFDGLAVHSPTPQLLINETIAAGQSYRLRRVEVITRAFTSFSVLVNSERVKYGKTSASESTVSLPFEPWVAVGAGDIIQLLLDQPDGPDVSVTVRIYYTDNTTP